LTTTCKLIAPFVPFLAEAMWQNLAVAPFGDRVVESVHLCDYPTPDEERIDQTLCEQMSLVREIVSLGRSARMAAKLKVRQPLAGIEVVLADDTHAEWLQSHAALICAELNVKKVELTTEGDEYITYTVLPDLKRLGPKVGKAIPALRKALSEADGGELLTRLKTDGKIMIDLPTGPIELDEDDIQIRLQAKEGWTAAQGRQCVVVLSTELTDKLIIEGYGNELVRVIQDIRKQMNLQYTDRIEVAIVTEAEEPTTAMAQHGEYIRGETLAVSLGSEPIEGVEPIEVTQAGLEMTVYVKVT